MFCQRLQLCFFHFFPAIFRYRHALHCAKAMILAAQAPAISPHSFLFRNRSVDGCFSSAIRANHCFFLLLRLTPALRAVVGFGAAVLLRSVLTPRCFAPFFRPASRLTAGRRLRRCAGALPRAHGSVLCTLLFGLPPHLRWCVGFAAALPRLTSESACVFRSQFSAEPFRRFSAFGV